jgi:hypothetical protein
MAYTVKQVAAMSGVSVRTREEMFEGFPVAAGKDRFNEGFNRH